MAQQIALRVHADRRSHRTILFHPTCHLDHFEGRGYERLHGLHGRPVGDATRLLTLDDLRTVSESPAALLLELPQREIGGQLPSWDELVAQAEWARGRGAAVHMDGARLWGCESFYERSLAEISEPFDTVYVSFYKQLGGLAGACLAGPEDVVAEVREWRRRHGGTLYGLWPLAGLRAERPADQVAAHRVLPGTGARDRGRRSATSPTWRCCPDPPHTTMMHLFLRREAEPLRAAVVRLAKQERIWTFSFWASDVPGVQRAELEVGDATLGFSPEEFRGVIERLLHD